ncbi:MAG: hypothetical protein Q9184_007365 [Pyrenodesmia sp. 2 TL-2023]
MAASALSSILEKLKEQVVHGSGLNGMTPREVNMMAHIVDGIACSSRLHVDAHEKPFPYHHLGLSKATTAASFLRPSKSFDQPIGFLDAMKRKYGSGDSHDRDIQALHIGGKKVNEVGFDIITQLQSAWSDLTVISLNGLCINGVSAGPEVREVARAQIASLGLKCRELDLSRNLLEIWHDVVDICFAMPELRTLKLK